MAKAAKYMAFALVIEGIVVQAAEIDNHGFYHEENPNIPNCSYAGFQYGEKEPPNCEVVLNVIDDVGAKGDGVTDDSILFNRAIAKVDENKGGIVTIPEGVFKISNIINIKSSHVILRGAGIDKTILYFDKSLSDLSQPSKMWSWTGGLLTVEPPNPVRLNPEPLDIVVKSAVTRASNILKLSANDRETLSKFKNKIVFFRWTGDKSMCYELFGHESAKLVDWDKWIYWDWAGGRLIWEWHNEITDINDHEIVFKKPFRVDIRPEWNVTIKNYNYLTHVGIEHLTIRMPIHKREGHLEDKGFNGIYFHRCFHCWVRNVSIENSDNGVILYKSSNNSLLKVQVKEGTCHHALSFRYASHDNLVKDFVISSKCQHGISAQDLTSGNVWSGGLIESGTLDLHRGMAFDSIRTNIKIINADGWCGGDENGGPFAGRRIVHWNIEVTGKRKRKSILPFASPNQYAMGALVGIRGVDQLGDETEIVAMPPGPKGTIVADWGKIPDPPDLYEAQLKHRLSQNKGGK